MCGSRDRKAARAPILPKSKQETLRMFFAMGVIYSLYLHTYMHTYVSAYIHIYIYIHIYMCVCIYVYIHIYI